MATKEDSPMDDMRSEVEWLDAYADVVFYITIEIGILHTEYRRIDRFAYPDGARY